MKVQKFVAGGVWRNFSWVVNGYELGATHGLLMGNFGIDPSLAMSKAFWSESFSWILGWKFGQRFGQKFSVGSQLGHSGGLLLGNFENASR